MDLLTKYWSDVKPHFRFLKEVLQTMPRTSVEKMVNHSIAREDLDPLILHESVEFLRLSIINLLGYKHVVCGKYLAWGRVTLYYSEFYIINCLLRLKGFALVHLNFLDDDPMVIRIDRTKDNLGYGMQKCGASGHSTAWKRFSELYPDLFGSSKELKKLIKNYWEFSMDERADWCYDLKYASQTTSKYALIEAEDRCKHNFLDPEFGVSFTAEEGEYYENLMSSFGYEEAGTGDYQKYAINYIADIGKASKFRKWYLSFFESILKDIEVLSSPQGTKEEIAKRIKRAISQLG